MSGEIEKPMGFLIYTVFLWRRISLVLGVVFLFFLMLNLNLWILIIYLKGLQNQTPRGVVLVEKTKTVENLKNSLKLNYPKQKYTQLVI